MTQAKQGGYVDLSDFILKMDRKQASADGKLCPVDPDHGRLQVHGSGAVLMCCNKQCEYHESLSKDDVAA
jgi:hypothetical protein